MILLAIAIKRMVQHSSITVVLMAGLKDCLVFLDLFWVVIFVTGK